MSRFQFVANERAWRVFGQVASAGEAGFSPDDALQRGVGQNNWAMHDVMHDPFRNDRIETDVTAVLNGKTEVVGKLQRLTVIGY